MVLLTLMVGCFLVAPSYAKASVLYSQYDNSVKTTVNANTVHAVSFAVYKTGITDLYIDIQRSVANGTVYFDCSNGTLGSIQGSVLGTSRQIVHISTNISQCDDAIYLYDSGGTGTLDIWGSDSDHPFVVMADSPVLDFYDTRFIPPVLPVASSTVATSSVVTIGGHVFVSPVHYVEGKTYVRMSFVNFTASLVTGSALQAWDTAFNNIEIPVTASSTVVDFSTTTDKFSIYLGKTEGNYQLIVKDCPWYGFGLFCTSDVLVATSTYFYIGHKTGFDADQEAGNLGVFGLAPSSDPFNGTTTNAVLDCDIAVSFKLDKCLWSFVIPNGYLTNQVLTNYKSLPILGWPIRFVEIAITTTATTSLPTINYTFSNANSFVGGINIHFDPWQYMFVSGSLVKDSWVADNGSGNIWDIMGPFVKLVVYMTLGFYIIRRLTGLNWGGEYTTTETGSETVSSSEKLPNGARKTFTHSITKRRRL